MHPPGSEVNELLAQGICGPRSHNIPELNKLVLVASYKLVNCLACMSIIGSGLKPQFSELLMLLIKAVLDGQFEQFF